MRAQNSHKGFTLIEMIIVIVVLGIVSIFLGGYIFSMIQAYTDTSQRTELVAKGRQALERIDRELRHAVPNTVSVLAGGQGIEFLSARSGGRLVERFEDFGQAFNVPARRFESGKNKSLLYSVGTEQALQANDHLVISNLAPSDITNGLTVVGLNSIVQTQTSPDRTTDGQILGLSSNHSFPYDSPGRHYQITNFAHEIGLTGGALHWRRTPAIGDYNGAVDWSAADPLLMDGVDSILFSYTSGASGSREVVSIDLGLRDGDETIRLFHQVHIRNTP
jgi:MSHA biogenesis protein MshO